MPVRVRLALMVAASLVLIGALAVVVLASPDSKSGDSTHFEGSLRPVTPVTDFTLSDEDGDPVSLSDYRGKPLILTFMYSTCQDTCPILASQIRQALDNLGSAAVPALAVSVDPANDTESRAKRFLVEHQVIGRMKFLLGSEAQLAPVWNAYGIAPETKENPHGAWVILLDGDGRQRIGFPVDQVTPERLTHDVRMLAQAQSDG
ncbi:MAG TPA: SCO family protein [Baekduia sp.]|nr:SCO family protein [Baekduia sp.]